MRIKHISRTTAYSIMSEIGDTELLAFIRRTFVVNLFSSHDFIESFVAHYSVEYERMQDVYAEYGDICYRRKMIANAIGRYLGNHCDRLCIEKVRVERSKNINETMSSATVWRIIL